MISAVVLAAGYSSRMKTPKPLLEWKGLPFIEHVCRALRRAGVDETVVVLGDNSEEVLGAWRPSREKVAVNPTPADGQLSSLRAGLQAADVQADAFMVCLADQPTVLPETYSKIIEAWESRKKSIIIPRVMRLKREPGEMPFKRGHPIMICREYRHLCFEGPLEQGLHWVTHYPGVNVFDVNVFDGGIIRDFDTPADYRRLIKETETTEV